MPLAEFKSRHAETQEAWQTRMASEALAIVKSELYLDFRFLDVALSALTPLADEQALTLATDGATLIFQPSAILSLYQKNPQYLSRLVLHSLFHCVFRHLWLKGNRDTNLWHVACDISVEHVIDHLGKKSVARPLSYVRQHTYQTLLSLHKTISATTTYQWLEEQSIGVQKQLFYEFQADDHRLWPKDDAPQSMPPQAQKTWQKIGERMQSEQNLRAKDAGSGSDPLQEELSIANRTRRSYRDFLRKFCILREELKLDPDEFDLNFYSYGLSVYGNLPLIEPLETRESYKIEELVLVIDTSYSTSGELVKSFLQETYALLKQRENFFHRMHLRILQADDKIQQDDIIRTEADLIRLMEHFTLQGGGGTDFRPAFSYVQRLCEEGAFQNLRGLLYFTDGIGTFPTKRPAFDAAFLFLGEQFESEAVPSWAMKLILDETEFRAHSAQTI